MRAAGLVLVLLVGGTLASGNVGANSVVDAVTRAAGPVLAAGQETTAGTQAQAREVVDVTAPFAGDTADVLLRLASTTSQALMEDVDFALQTTIEEAAYLTCEPPAFGRSTNWILWGVGLQSCVRAAPGKAGGLLGL